MPAIPIIETVDKDSVFGRILANTCPVNIVDFVDGKWITCPCSYGAKSKNGCDHYDMIEYDLHCPVFYVVVKFTYDNKVEIYYSGFNAPM